MPLFFGLRYRVTSCFRMGFSNFPLVLLKGIYLVFLLLLTGCFSGSNQESSTDENRWAKAQKHRVTFAHKGDKTGKPLTKSLFQLPISNYSVESDIKNASYYMDVVTVFCGENVCKTDRVRLFWDALGFYHHLSLGKGVKLEKGNALDFEEEDYVKLDKLLGNRDSGLKQLERYELVSESSSGNAVDALTGATVSLNKKDYITGAIWTCYTLWHFVNGELFDVVRNFTGNDMTLQELHTYAVGDGKGGTDSSSDIVKYQTFGLEQLIRRKAVDSATIDLVMQAALNNASESQPTVLQPLFVKYVETLPDDLYFTNIQKLIFSNNQALNWNALTSLSNRKSISNHDYYLTLVRHFVKFASYKQTKLLLNILNKQQQFSVDINIELTKFLNHENFVLARAVYWALREQQTSVDVNQQLAIFEKRHSNRL